MSAFKEKLRAASAILLEAETEVAGAHVDLPPGEASGILVAARHLIERVLSYSPDREDATLPADTAENVLSRGTVAEVLNSIGRSEFPPLARP